MTEPLKKIQYHLEEMVTDIVDICKIHQIPLFAVGGTLLGAVRYKGFIPWDDDLDFGIYRSDLDKLANAIRQTEKYDIHIPLAAQEGNYVRFPKIYRKNTTYLQTTEQVAFDQRLFLDVFTIENVPDQPLNRMKHGLLSEWYSMLGAYVFFSTEGRYHLAKKSFVARQVVTVIGKLFGFRSYSYWNAKAFEVFGAYQHDLTKAVTLPGGAKHYFGEILERSVFGQGKDLPFESLFISGPEQIEQYLTNRYGPNYMTPPSVTEQVNHNIVYFEIDGEVIIK